jgi:predicted transcriptional regulator
VGVERVSVSDYPPKQILNKIEKIEKQINRIEKKLDEHIDLIMSVYKPLKKPLDKFREYF